MFARAKTYWTELSLTGKVLVLASLVMAFLPTKWLACAVIIDDALYYPRLAAYFVQGQGVSFDGVTVTNGVHPLWAAILVPFALLFQDPEGWWLLRASLLLCAVFMAISLMLTASIGRRLQWGAGGSVALFLLFVLRADLWMSLMESALSLALLLAVIDQALARGWMRAESHRASILFGVMLGLLFLSRLDFVFVVVVLLTVSLAVRLRAGASLLRAARPPVVTGLAFTAVSLPYLLLNLAYFGNIVPVSGRRKHLVAHGSASPADALRDAIQGSFTTLAAKIGLPPIALLLGLGVATLVGIAIIRRLPRRQLDTAFASDLILPGTLAAAALRWAYLRVQVAEAGSTPWYWVPEFAMACLVIGYLVGRAEAALGQTTFVRLQSGPFRAAGAALALALSVTYIHWDGSRVLQANAVPYDAALWARQHLTPTHKRCAMWDPGVFSYFSRIPTLALNGLIADEAFMRRSLAGDANGLMRDYKADCLVYYFDQQQWAKVPAAARIHAFPPTPSGTYAGRILAIVDPRLHSPWPDVPK